MFTGFLQGSLLGAARERGLVDIRLIDIRDFAEGPHRQVDDRPFGGGPGMLLMPGPVVASIEHVQGQATAPGQVILFTPGGRRLDQPLVEELARREAAQWPLDQKRACAHHVVSNEGDPASLRAQVRAVLDEACPRPGSPA